MTTTTTLAGAGRNGFRAPDCVCVCVSVQHPAANTIVTLGGWQSRSSVSVLLDCDVPLVSVCQSKMTHTQTHTRTRRLGPEGIKDELGNPGQSSKSSRPHLHATRRQSTTQVLKKKTLFLFPFSFLWRDQMSVSWVNDLFGFPHSDSWLGYIKRNHRRPTPYSQKQV